MLEVGDITFETLAQNLTVANIMLSNGDVKELDARRSSPRHKDAMPDRYNPNDERPIWLPGRGPSGQRNRRSVAEIGWSLIDATR